MVMMYLKYHLSLRNVEDLLRERGIDICHKTGRFGGSASGRCLRQNQERARVPHAPSPVAMTSQ